MRIRFTRAVGVLLVGGSLTLGAPTASAQISLIRDVEIETTIRTYAAPLFKAAGLDADAVRVHLVNDSRLNAFVAGGMNLFINTGLLLRAESPNQVVGVIAHETGHIAGGHLARTDDALRGASMATILAYVLGAAAIVAGAPGGGAAVIVGGQSIAQSTILQYSRGQEQAADQFAVSVLDRTEQSSRGLLEFIEILSDQDVLLGRRQDPYLQTHPLTRDRINFVRHHASVSPYTDNPDPSAWEEPFRRMQAKLQGFLNPPPQTFAKYPDTDLSIEARYARSVAYYRRANVPRALGEIESLIDERPDDPYFRELKGQILFENGRVDDAVGAYRRAVEMAPKASLIRVSLAQAMIETGDSQMLEEAGEHLEITVRQGEKTARTWRLLSIVYGRTDRPGLSALSSAERALEVGRYEEAIAFSTRAAKGLPFGSPGRLRAEDIESAARIAKKKHKN